MANSKSSKKKAVHNGKSSPSEPENLGDSSDDGVSVDEDGPDLSSFFNNKNEENADEELDDDDDDIQEVLEDSRPEKRKHEGNEDEPRSKISKSKKKNVKPPTAEEMLVLRETENLFSSNLIRLQIDEMLSELKPKKSVKRYIPPWLENLKKFLTGMEPSESHNLSDIQWLKDMNVSLPLRTKQQIGEGKAVFQFKTPLDVFPIGSQAMGCPLGPFYSIDLAVVMPKGFLLHNDNLNQKYHFKRALYLCYIAGHIQNNELLSSEHKPQFMLLAGDPRKPLLVLHPTGKLSKFIKFRLHPIPEENSFPFKRLLPSKNNIRPKWWGIDKDILPPTPNYNASILEDMVLKQNHSLKIETFAQNQNLKDAFVLLRVWLKQRELNEGFGAFNSHILSMLLVYLLKICKINKHMSSYQIIRHVWLYLGESDWLENGPSLCDVKQEEAPSTEEFHIYYDIVFVDASGFCNLAASLNKQIYLQVRNESKLAIQLIDNQNLNSFSALFLMKVPFIRQYDILVSFHNFPALAKIVKSKGDEVTLMDHLNNVSYEYLRLLTDLLEKGVGKRLSSIGILQNITSKQSWNLDERFPNLGHLYVGLNLNPETALSLIDKGPLPDDPGADEFREFWGEKCDLRRFKDGTVCESVVWEEKESTLDHRRCVTENIIDYLLKTKFDVADSFYHIVSKSFHSLIHPCIPNPQFLNREETSKKILLAYEGLTRQLVELKDLPLSVVSVYCISPAYRFTDPFPPGRAQDRAKGSLLFDNPAKGRIFTPDSRLGRVYPDFIPPIDCVIQMSLTQKWPNDLNACKRLIAAFNIALAAALKNRYNLSCQVTTDYFVVNKDGFLFRLYLGYSREIALLKLKISETGLRMYRDTPESLAVEKKFVNLPKLTGAIYRLSEEYPGFSSAACLAKRWISAQLFDDFHFPFILIELFMANIFMHPEPYNRSVGTFPSFLRFLSFVSTTDWLTTPIIVNFNSILTKDEIKELEDAFQNNRSSYPPLFLATPYDKTGSLWTKTVPTVSTLLRLTKLAQASLQIIETHVLDISRASSILKVFKPPMPVYDAVIKLNKPYQFREKENLFQEDTENAKESFASNATNRFSKSSLPILGFNPVDLYVSDLRVHYGSLALFFYDPHGGTEIGVSFVPTFLNEEQFQISSVNGRKPVQKEGKTLLKPHLDSIFEGFKIMSNGIVESIELGRLKEKLN